MLIGFEYDDIIIYIYKYYILVYIYIWSPPPPGPTFSHPRRGRCHRDIYNKIVHSTETMEKTVKNEHLSKRKLICTESKNCCKSVLFRPKFGLESHGLKYIWYPPQVLKWDVRSKMIAKLSVSLLSLKHLYTYIYNSKDIQLKNEPIQYSIQNQN